MTIQELTREAIRLGLSPERAASLSEARHLSWPEEYVRQAAWRLGFTWVRGEWVPYDAAHERGKRAARRKNILRLRRGGLTFQNIAEIECISTARAHQIAGQGVTG